MLLSSDANTFLPTPPALMHPQARKQGSKEPRHGSCNITVERGARSHTTTKAQPCCLPSVKGLPPLLLRRQDCEAEPAGECCVLCYNNGARMRAPYYTPPTPLSPHEPLRSARPATRNPCVFFHARNPCHSRALPALRRNTTP